MEEEIQLNNRKNYFGPEADVSIKFNLFDWLEEERQNGYSDELFTGLAEFAVEYIVRDARDRYYSINMDTNWGQLVQMLLAQAKQEGALDEIAANHVARLQHDLKHEEETNNRHNSALSAINSKLMELEDKYPELYQLRSSVLGHYYQDKPLDEPKH